MSDKMIQFKARKKEVSIAYFLLFASGILGAHRIYLGDYLFGVTYFFLFVWGLIANLYLGANSELISNTVFIGLIALAMYDLMTIPGQVEKTNRKIASDLSLEV